LVHLSVAVEIEPEKDRSEGEAQRVDLVGYGWVDVSGGDLRHRSEERHGLIVTCAPYTNV
jgi:hypothetical protein